MYQLSSGDLQIMAVWWKRYFTDKLNYVWERKTDLFIVSHCCL